MDRRRARHDSLQANLAGESWQPVKLAIPPVSLNSIAFGKNGFGLIVGNRGLVLRTENGGTAWKPLANHALTRKRFFRSDFHEEPGGLYS